MPTDSPSSIQKPTPKSRVRRTIDSSSRPPTTSAAGSRTLPAAVAVAGRLQAGRREAIVAMPVRLERSSQAPAGTADPPPLRRREDREARVPRVGREGGGDHRARWEREDGDVRLVQVQVPGDRLRLE